MLLPEYTRFCWAWNRVYLKANGRVPCWCDAGEPYTVVHKKFDEVDFVRDIVNSAEMCAMRRTLILNNDNYIKECKNCCCMTDVSRGKHYRFQDAEKPQTAAITDSVNTAAGILHRVHNQKGWPLGSIDRIVEIQLEPSFPCNLRCPGCLQGFHANPMSTESAPYVFPYEWFELMLRSIIHNGVKLNRIAFIGRGEPTLNRKYPEMLKFAKNTMPDLKMSMDTNSNQPFKPEYLLLNFINCSIDGSDQESYGKYRKGGAFSKALEFMRAGSELKKQQDSKCRIRWKYILFDSNDSDECLNRAQKIALDLDITQLDFIITSCGAVDGTVLPSSRFRTLEQLNGYINSNKIFPRVTGSRST